MFRNHTVCSYVKLFQSQYELHLLVYPIAVVKFRYKTYRCTSRFIGSVFLNRQIVSTELFFLFVFCSKFEFDDVSIAANEFRAFRSATTVAGNVYNCGRERERCRVTVLQRGFGTRSVSAAGETRSLLPSAQMLFSLCEPVTYL
jgi:hypothetical protein